LPKALHNVRDLLQHSTVCKRRPLSMYQLLLGAKRSAKCSPFYWKWILTTTDYNVDHFDTTKPCEPFLHDRFILQCVTIRCFCSN
jgi:hypothetical protein